ncbi:gamma-glutamylcyclotransferase [Alteromonas halophila]|uniref:Gamma-glutamylcyclotransferase n=1 Tax=Alteromonas halophila TaxID=516698 RepID=A0A918JGS0_9ALTE|nr:gamma-glutamylcyclotransferase [Alteromonas halophila]GGW80256.1 hypothetical protein GCM10007391_11400 [Alteromonas halophila]
MQQAILDTWFEQVSQPYLVLGYGSLMSADSRQRFSEIQVPGLPVMVEGFYRAWVTRSETEQQTYVGAIAERGASLNAQLIPASIDPALEDREKDYRFVPVSLASVDFSLPAEQARALGDWLSEKTLFICETLDSQPADTSFPVSQTYIDTCLAGCLEHGGTGEARRFIQTTRGWQHPRRQDRDRPYYPRAAHVAPAVLQQIDALLSGAGGA